MKHHENLYETGTVLILNRPQVPINSKLYMEMVRIPEVLSRLRQYREILNKNDMYVPVWLYCLIQDIRSLKGSPQFYILSFLINMGLFDRWIARSGWPHYFIGSDPLISTVTGEISFEEQVLLLNRGYEQSLPQFQLYKAASYYNRQTASFCLTQLKRKKASYSLKDILVYFREKVQKEECIEEWVFQLLAPHELDIMEGLETCGVFPKDFLEKDQELKWLWPVWKKSQIDILRGKPVVHQELN